MSRRSARIAVRRVIRRNVLWTRAGIQPRSRFQSSFTSAMTIPAVTKTTIAICIQIQVGDTSRSRYSPRSLTLIAAIAALTRVLTDWLAEAKRCFACSAPSGVGLRIVSSARPISSP